MFLISHHRTQQVPEGSQPLPTTGRVPYKIPITAGGALGVGGMQIQWDAEVYKGNSLPEPHKARLISLLSLLQAAVNLLL